MKNKKMDTSNTIQDVENKKFEDFLELLKNDPEAIDIQIIRNEYKELLDKYFEKVKRDFKRDKYDFKSAYEIIDLLKLKILDHSEIKDQYKDQYKDLLKIAFKRTEDQWWIRYGLPQLINLKILDNSEIRDQYKDLLKIAFKNAKEDSNRATTAAVLGGWKIMEENEVKDEYKDQYMDLLKIAFEKGKEDFNWVFYAIPELIKLKILDVCEIKDQYKDQYKDLLKIAFEKGKKDSRWANAFAVLLDLKVIEKSKAQGLENEKKEKDIVNEQQTSDIPERFITKIFRKSLSRKTTHELIPVEQQPEENEIKDQYLDLLKIAFKNAKEDHLWAWRVGDLLELKILREDEIKEYKIKEQYMDLLKIAFEKGKTDNYRLGQVVPRLLKLKILNKNDYTDLLKIAFENAKEDYKQACLVTDLLKNLKILKEDEIKKNRIKEQQTSDISKRFITKFFRKSSSGKTTHELIPVEQQPEENEIKDQYLDLLKIAFKNAKEDYQRACLVTDLLKNLKILNEDEIKKNGIKDQYKDLLKIAFEKGEEDYYWTYRVVDLLNLKILKEDEIKEYKIKEKYNELLGKVKEKVKGETGFEKDWAKSAVNLLKLNIVDKNELKKYYKELLEVSFEKARFKKDWASIVSELLKLDIIEKSEINVETINNITFTRTSFFVKNKDIIGVQDIKFINKVDDYFSREEIDYLSNQEYEYFKEIEIAVKEKNYQKIWEVKKESYPQAEKDKLQRMEEHFGEGVWTYFVDKVPGDKKLKNRFRDPHSALLHVTDIIDLATQLESKGIDKENFIKNYLGVAGDRNNGYQQLNDFLEKLNDFLKKYKSSWEKSVEEAMNVVEFKENIEFMNLAKGILEQGKTGELYKNLDNFEQILTLLHMIRHKEALIKLQKLAESKDPQDKKLYEYYKGAIYHPRTKPIIMEMYEDPGKFLGLDDTTFRDLKKIHQAKKPSNMVENFEFLDFDARDLVNCLPLGIYDQLSYFKPFEMKFYISGSDVYTKQELQQKISEFLLCAENRKISAIINKLKKEQGDTTKYFNEGKINRDEFIKNILGKHGAEDLIKMFVNLGYIEFNKYKNLREMTAKISPKCDPNNRFNGFNCDSLAEGHGKKVVAMFNPYCTDFCIYEGDQNLEEDNLKVTSWVTLNRAIPGNFTKLLDKVKSQTTHDIVSVLGSDFEDYKDPNEYVITMDNIEANPNFGSKNELAVRKMYEKFFSEYVKQNPVSPNGIPINTTKFYSGVNYNKLNILTNTVDNESLPVFVNAYSDNSESYSLQGKLEAGEQKEKEKKVGIHPLSIEDVVQISYMEGKIYPASMKDHLGNLQHEITASILNNTLKNRPNLSFAWYNEKGKIGGYILAYQGKMEDGTPGIYISDFSMYEAYRGVRGGRMVYYRINQVKKYYPEMPIFTRARESTSYHLVEHAEKYGYTITQDEIVEDGGEIFHRVAMEPKK